MRTSRAKSEALIESAVALRLLATPLPLLDTLRRPNLPGALSRLPQRRLNPTMFNVLHILTGYLSFLGEVVSDPTPRRKRGTSAYHNGRNSATIHGMEGVS